MKIGWRKEEPYERMRKCLIRETEVASTYGIRFPDRVPRIPTLEVRKGTFDPVFSDDYWSQRVGLHTITSVI